MTAPPGSDLTQQLLELAARARVVDLSHTIEPGIPVYPTHPQYFAMKWETHDPAAMNQLLIGEHAGTPFEPSSKRCAPACFVSSSV